MKIIPILAPIAAAGLLAACGTTMTERAATGGLAGAAAGAAIDGSVTGAVVGGAVGAGIGAATTDRRR